MVNNKLRPMLRVMLVLSIVVGILLAAFPQVVAAQDGQNLLQNGGFEQGWYDVSGTQQSPNNWKMHWTEGEAMGDLANVTARPESRVLPKTQVPPAEHNFFFWDGSHTLKIFWAKAPIHVGISQDVGGLEVGREYRFIVPTYVDTFQWDGGKKPPSDPYAAEIRLGAGSLGANWQDAGAINFSNWANSANTSPFYLARTTLQFDFVATAPEMTVFVEYTSKWGLDNNGVFFDALRLEPLGMAQPPTATPLPAPPTATPGPSPTPLPTSTPRPDGAIVHIVESGDTLSSIALQYGLTVEELRELNAGSIGSDNLIRTGQELVVSVPSGESATPTPLPPPPTATSEPASEPSPTATSQPAGASICVVAFHDRNGDRVRDDANEELLPNVAFTIADAAGVVGEYTSDGVNEPHCFRELAAGTYRVIQQPPAGYEASGLPEQNVAVAEGTSIDLQFGNARTAAETEAGEAIEEEVEEVLAEESEQEAPDAVVSGDEDTTTDDVVGRVLANIARVAGVLVLILAGAIAVLFFLSRRQRY